MVTKKKILMLDDELPENIGTPEKPTPYMWYYAKALSQQAEFLVQFANTQALAKEYFNKSVFDIVCMDVIMPGGELEKTKNNTRTGLAFLDWIIERNFSGSVVILSLIDRETLSRELPANRGALKGVDIVEKIVTTPIMFARLMEAL
jgi:CheY-like chemotaxis protein